MTTTPPLPTSAARESVWARALRIGMERHGPTPTYEAVAADLGYRPTMAAIIARTELVAADGERLLLGEAGRT